MPDAIELENQERLKAIEAAPDWPTTSLLMNERDAWWKQHRRWYESGQAWGPIHQSGDKLASPGR